MYSVFISNKNEEPELIFNDKIPSAELALISPTLNVESGQAGSFEATLPPTNVGYSKIEQMKTEIIVKKNNKEVWRGRVLNPNTDFYNQMKIDVEGELTYLSDTYQPQHEYKEDTLIQVIEGILSIHNNKVGTYNDETHLWTPNANEPIDKIFYVGAVFVSEDDPTGTDVSYRKTDYDTTLSALKKIADKYKGYFIVRRQDGKRYLDFVKDFTLTCNQRIDFGINLLDYSKSFKMEDLCTVALPIGGTVKDTDFTEADEMYIYHSENESDVNFLDTDGNLGYDPNAGDREAGVVYMNEYGLHSGDKIYVSTAQIDDATGYQQRFKDGIWAFAEENGTPIAGSVKVYNSTYPQVETYEKEAITIPAGAHRFRIAHAVGYDPQLKVYKQKAESGLDEHFTIAPYGDVDDENFKHTPGDVYLIYKPLYEKYGWHEKKLEFNDLEKSEDLWNMATYWLTHTQFEQMTLELTAFDLAAYSSSYDDIWINMNIPIYSRPHGLTSPGFTLPCTKMSVKLGDPDNTEYTLGYTTPSEISDTQSSVNADMSKILDQMPTMSSTFKAIQENATQIINSMASVGAVTFLHEDPQNPNQITSIVISNTQDPDTATSQWKWSMGGFGYRKKDPQTGEWGAYDTAITMDGTIMGQFIAAETIYGDRIRGGTLTLGRVGLPQDDGSIAVLSADNHRVAGLEKDWGLTVETDDNDTDDGYLVRVRNGVIYGGFKHTSGGTNSKNGITDGDVGEQCTGRIRFNTPYVGEGYTKYGVDIRGGILGIVTDGIWLRKSADLSSALYVGLDDEWVTCADKRIHFIHGIAVEVQNINNGGE